MSSCQHQLMNYLSRTSTRSCSAFLQFVMISTILLMLLSGRLRHRGNFLTALLWQVWTRVSQYRVRICKFLHICIICTVRITNSRILLTSRQLLDHIDALKHALEGNLKMIGAVRASLVQVVIIVSWVTRIRADSNRPCALNLPRKLHNLYDMKPESMIVENVYEGTKNRKIAQQAQL